MFRRDPEPFESHCDSAVCASCSTAREWAREDGIELHAGIRLPRPTLAFTTMGTFGARAVGYDPAAE